MNLERYDDLHAHLVSAFAMAPTTACDVIRTVTNGLEDGDPPTYIAEVLLFGMPESVVEACRPYVESILGRPVATPERRDDVTPERRDEAESVTPPGYQLDSRPLRFDVAPKPGDEEWAKRTVTHHTGVGPTVQVCAKDASSTVADGMRKAESAIKEAICDCIDNAPYLREELQNAGLTHEANQPVEELLNYDWFIERLMGKPSFREFFRDCLKTGFEACRRSVETHAKTEQAPKIVEPIPETTHSGPRARGKAKPKPYYHFGQLTANKRRDLVNRAAAELGGPDKIANRSRTIGSNERLWHSIRRVAWMLQFDIEGGATADQLVAETNGCYYADDLERVRLLVQRAIAIAKSEASEVLEQIPGKPAIVADCIQNSNTGEIAAGGNNT